MSRNRVITLYIIELDHSVETDTEKSLGTASPECVVACLTDTGHCSDLVYH